MLHRLTAVIAVWVCLQTVPRYDAQVCAVAFCCVSVVTVETTFCTVTGIIRVRRAGRGIEGLNELVVGGVAEGPMVLRLLELTQLLLTPAIYAHAVQEVRLLAAEAQRLADGHAVEKGRAQTLRWRERGERTSACAAMRASQ